MSETPDFIGQKYTDSNTGNVWNATGTTAGAWALQLQNLGLEWEPSSIDIGPLLFFATYANNSLSGITRLVINHTSTTEGYDFEGQSPTLASLEFPNLGSVTGNVGLAVIDMPALVHFHAPQLVSCATTFIVRVCPLLTDIQLPLFQGSAANQVSFINNTTLSSLSLPAFIPNNLNNIITFANCALDAASVNGLLARAVANAAYTTGDFDLSGGTNAQPSGQGIADKATLIGRGVNVLTN